MPRSLSPTKILTRAEIMAVLDDLATRRSKNGRVNSVIFGLATACGLRASEIAQLQMRDVRVQDARSHIVVRAKLKRGKPRTVHLWWDRANMAVVLDWHTQRVAEGAHAGDPFVCTQSVSRFGGPLHRNSVRAKFRVACRVLGPDRLANLTTHHGRHTCGTFAALHHPLAAVRDMLGHASISTTSIYLHVPTGDDDELGDLFGPIK